MYTLPSRNEPVVNSINSDPDLKHGNVLVNASFRLEWYCLINAWAFKKLSGQVTEHANLKLPVKQRGLVHRVVDSILSKLLEKSWTQKGPVAILFSFRILYKIFQCC